MRDRRTPDLFDQHVDPERAPSGRERPATAPATVVVFPLAARRGKVRDVARKLMATRTDRHADSYRNQVTEALRVHLRAKHVPTEQHNREIGAFWRAVALELARQQHGRAQA